MARQRWMQEQMNSFLFLLLLEEVQIKTRNAQAQESGPNLTLYIVVEHRHRTPTLKLPCKGTIFFPGSQSSSVLAG